MASSRGPDAISIRAALVAAELHRRTGDIATAAALWARVCRWVPGHMVAHEQLGKVLEHRLRDPAAALAVVAASRAPCPHRQARLERKNAGGPIPGVAAVLTAACERGAVASADARAGSAERDVVPPRM